MEQGTSTDPRTGPAEVPTPPPPAPPRRHTLRTVLITVAGTIVALAVIGILFGPRMSGELLAEDFESEPVEFSVESDPISDLRVQDGAYVFEVKEANTPMVTRHVFPQAHKGLTFEATAVHPTDVGEQAAAALGCWAGSAAYLFVTSPHGEAAVIGTRGESGEIGELTEMIPIDDAGPAGEPNELRLECVGGEGQEPTIVSGYVNGDPVVSVSIPNGYDSFDAIGFWVMAGAPTTFTFDDVLVTAERAEPGLSPIPATAA
jgi:hypothetical protein